MHVDDLASAALFLMQNYNEAQFVNVGVGHDISISDLATLTARVVGYSGQCVFDTTKPDGTPRKLMDSSRLTALGWHPKIDLEVGIRTTYDWFISRSD